MANPKPWNVRERERERYAERKAEELQKAKNRIGSKAAMIVGPASFDVAVLDAERRLGTLHYRVKPARGSGKAWLCHERLRF